MMDPFGLTPDRRDAPRTDCALALRWPGQTGHELGYVANLALGGLCVRARKLEAAGFEAPFTISREEGEVVVEARVIWSRRLQLETHVSNWHEMGLLLTGEPSPEYLDLLRSVEEPAYERRRFRRFSHAMVVKVKRGEETFYAKSVDVSQQGVLIFSDKLPALDEKLALEMSLPGTRQPLALEARVVRVVPGGEGRVGGFAVAFKGFSEDEEKMLVNYLKIVKELRRFASSV